MSSNILVHTMVPCSRTLIDYSLYVPELVPRKYKKESQLSNIGRPGLQSKKQKNIWCEENYKKNKNDNIILQSSLVYPESGP